MKNKTILLIFICIIILSFGLSVSYASDEEPDPIIEWHGIKVNK